jgi:2-methylcitrate dehydratase PrpD
MPLATQGLGVDWEVLRVAVKPIPACHFVHACIDAATALRPALNHGELSHIVARVAQGYVPVVCEPVAQKRRPANAYEAQFSVQYGIATALRHGKFGLQALEAQAMQDPATLALADMVRYEVDPDANYPKYFPGEVVLHFKDGHQVSHQEPINRGAPGRPIAHADIVAKFMDNAALAWPQDAVAQLRQRVLDLPHQRARDLAQDLGA